VFTNERKVQVKVLLDKGSKLANKQFESGVKLTRERNQHMAVG